MYIREALKYGIHKLRDASVDSYTLAAELLLLDALQHERTWLYSHPEEQLAPAQEKKYLESVQRRISGEPVQHITGHQEFWGLDFEVSADVLIPRPETEHLIEVALDRLAVREIQNGRPQKNNGEGLLIADIGTGSGCIAIALAKELPAAQFIATDISLAALQTAKRNAAKHKVVGRVQFLECNLLEGPNKTSGFDLVVSNPPYVGLNEKGSLTREVRDHEPATALFGGEEGYELYADLITQAAVHLKPGGLLVLELGHKSLPAVQPLLDVPTWQHAAVTKDLSGIDRIIAAEKI